MCLLGANGSGKTTLVNILAGLTDFDEGDVLLHLEDNPSISLKDEKKKFRSYIRLCQQNDFLFEELTGEEHLKLICKLRGISEKEAIEDEIKERSQDVNLDQSHMKKRVQILSPGARRKLSIAMSLIGDGKLLILDEPTSNLDLRSREIIWKLIKKLGGKKDLSILISTQHIEEADYIGSRVCILKDGKMLQCDTPENLKRLFGTGFRVKMLADTKKHVKYLKGK